MSTECEGKTTTKKPCPWKPVFRVTTKLPGPKTEDHYYCEVHVDAALRAGGRVFNLRTPRR